jgi:hypothetical protein
VRADPGLQRHGMAHEATDPPVAVQEGVDKISLWCAAAIARI